MRKVIIVSNIEDIHACAVFKLLKEKYGSKPIILDTSYYPNKNSITIGLDDKGNFIGEFTYPESFILDADTSVWWRRPREFTVNPEISDERLTNFVKNECKTTFEGIIEASKCRVINKIYSERRANNKTLQLATALELGFSIPKTYVTNNPIKAKSFVEENNYNVIYKPQTDAKYHIAETRAVDETFFLKGDLLELSPVVFQEHIQANFDLRVTVVGNEVFATQILSQEGIPKIDWRIDLKTPMKNFELDLVTKERCISLVKKLDLTYGAIDLRITPSDEVIFFEINPSGQFLFCEFDDRLPITNAICRALIE